MDKMFHFVIIWILSLSVAVVPVGSALAAVEGNNGHCREMPVSQQQEYQPQLAGVELSRFSAMKDCCHHCNGHCACAKRLSCNSHFVSKVITVPRNISPVVGTVISLLNTDTKNTIYHSISLAPHLRPPIS